MAFLRMSSSSSSLIFLTGLAGTPMTSQPVRKMIEEELEDIRRNAIEYLELWHRDYRG